MSQTLGHSLSPTGPHTFRTSRSVPISRRWLISKKLPYIRKHNDSLARQGSALDPVTEGNLYVTDSNQIREVVVATGAVTTLAVTDEFGAAVHFSTPVGVAVDGAGTSMSRTRRTTWCIKSSSLAVVHQCLPVSSAKRGQAGTAAGVTQHPKSPGSWPRARAARQASGCAIRTGTACRRCTATFRGSAAAGPDCLPGVFPDNASTQGCGRSSTSALQISNGSPVRATCG